MRRAEMKNDPSVKAVSGNMHDAMAGTLHYEMRRGSGALSALMTQVFGKLGLKPSEATLLLAIGHNPGCRQSDIARMHRSKAANLVPLIAKLERDGLLKRASGGGRAIALSLSEKGSAMLVKVESAFQKIEDHLCSALTADQRNLVVDALGTLCIAACHFDEL